MRISIKLVIILMLMNGFAGALVDSGVAEDWGVEPQPGGASEIDNTVDNASELQTGGGLGSTLFGMFATIGKTFSTIFNLVFYGPEMLVNLGVPSWMAGMFEGVIAVVVAGDVAYYFTGRQP